MKILHSKFEVKGENNRETYTAGSGNGRAFPEYSGGSEFRPG
jgi:hypothetical protein